MLSPFRPTGFRPTLSSQCDQLERHQDCPEVVRPRASSPGINTRTGDAHSFSSRKICALNPDPPNNHLTVLLPTSRAAKILYLLMAPFAAISRAGQLAVAMSAGPRKGLVLVQNPPSIPTLLVARALTWLSDGAALVIDWHNFGYTVSALPTRNKSSSWERLIYTLLWIESGFCPCGLLRS